MTHPSVDALARAMVRRGQVRIPPPPVARWRPATVQGVNIALRKCTVLLTGSATPITGVPFPASYTPVTGDICQVVINAVGGTGPADIVVVCKYGT